MNIKTVRKLGFRMTLYCIAFAVFLSLIVGALGVYTYAVNSEEHYENYLRAILDIESKNFNMEELKKTILHSEQNNSYYETQKRFNHIKDYSDVEYIYLLTQVENQKYEYVICGYGQEELKSPEELVQFRDVVGEEVDDKMLYEFAGLFTGQKESSVLKNSSDLGYVMTLTIPVFDEEEAIIGVLAADILMDDIQSDILSYITKVLAGTIAAMLIFLCIFLIAIQRNIIKPIMTIGKHANQFVEQTQRKPSEMQISEINIHTKDELELLSRQLNKMMKDIVEYMSGLESMTAIQERMNVQLDLARQIQQSMLPDTFPAFPERVEFDIHAVMKPAKAVGGDFYDFFLIDGTHLGIVIADVSGEGVPAALFMMRCKTLIKNYAILGLEPAKVFIETNNELCEANDGDMTVEAFMGILDVYSGELIFTSAGVHSPLILKENGEVFEVNVKQGFLLGTLEHIPFYQERIYLNKKDILCIYTCGMLRMENQAGEKILWKEMLKDLNKANLTAAEVVSGMEEEVKQFMGDGEQTEDFTTVVLKFEGYDI